MLVPREGGFGGREITISEWIKASENIWKWNLTHDHVSPLTLSPVVVVGLTRCSGASLRTLTQVVDW